MKRQWDIEELIEHFTLVEDDLEFLANKTGRPALAVRSCSNASNMRGVSLPPSTTFPDLWWTILLTNSSSMRPCMPSYLAVVLDLFSRLAMAATEDSALVELALRMALVSRHPQAGLLHHSDRGSEFTSERYQAVLLEAGIQVSMSRTADCYVNAAMASFFATLTKECTDRVRFQTRQEARSAIFEYLECFYNPVRLQSTLQYLSPVAFEQAAQSSVGE